MPSDSQNGLTLRPSGDAATARAWPVALSTTTISDGPPSTRRSAAIERPSGDHRGHEKFVETSEMSRRRLRRPSGVIERKRRQRAAIR